MIPLTIPLPAGLHQQPDRAAIVAQIKTALYGRHVPRRRYRCEIVLTGPWDKANGEPREIDTDNILKTLFDAMAEAFGFGKRGRGDCWFNRKFSLDTVHSLDTSLASVVLWPI